MVWPVRSLAAGVAGTATLTGAYALDHLLTGATRSLDYDDSRVPGQIVVSVLDLRHVTGRDKDELALAVRCSYGPAFALWHGALRRKMAEPWASAAFFTSLMSVTLTMFPLLGRTPPPWRWPRGYLATSLATHAAYVAAVALVDDGLR